MEKKKTLFKFEKQFGKGVDPWYAKMERWAKKQRFPINHLLLGLVAYLKEEWIEQKIENTMEDVDKQVEQIKEDWDAEEREQFGVINSSPSKVKGLNNFEINYNAKDH